MNIIFSAPITHANKVDMSWKQEVGDCGGSVLEWLKFARREGLIPRDHGFLPAKIFTFAQDLPAGSIVAVWGDWAHEVFWAEEV